MPLPPEVFDEGAQTIVLEPGIKKEKWGMQQPLVQLIKFFERRGSRETLIFFASPILFVGQRILFVVVKVCD